MPDSALPRYLYKYGSFEEPKSFERFEDILLNSRLWFASRASLNDPFELRPATSIDFDSPNFKEQFFEKLHNILRAKGAKGYEQRQALIEQQYSELTSKKFSIRDRYLDFLSTLGVYCLSENPDSLLMWAHYTSGHKGYRLKFDTQEWTDGFKHAAKVVYQTTYPEIDVWSLLTDFIESGGTTSRDAIKEADTKAVLTKSDEWCYEAEWRIIAATPQYIDFNPNGLVQVALGCNVNEKIAERVVELTKKRSPSVSLVKMIIDNKAYRIEEAHLS